MKIKSGVRILGIRPELLVGLIVMDGIFHAHGKELVVTAVTDGSHMKGSLHYSGCASDIRSHELSSIEKDIIIGEAIVSLGDDFDIIIEDEGKPNEHFHLEFQPKGPF